MKAIVCVLILLLAEANPIIAGDIVATGGWTEAIDGSDLASGAGSDLQSTYESATDATVLDVNPSSEFYRVDVHRSDINWPSSLTLYIKRTSDGTGGGSISFGKTYREVTPTDASFFNGYLSRSGINVQYKVTGMSIDIPPETYSTTVVFTIVDTGGP